MPYTRVEDPKKLQRLMAAVLMITADVELQDLLQHIVEEARSLVNARYGALGVLNPSRTGLEQFVTVGLSEDETQAIGPRPIGRGVLGLLITEPRPLRLERLGDHPESYGFPADHPPMTSFLGVPIRIRDDVYGNLYLTDKVGADAFSDEDEALAEALAQAAGIAIESSRLHDQVRIISVLDDRDRIARDLHDRVIQRIFAVGMTLQGVARMPDPTQAHSRIDKAVDELDATIAEIRSTIFELGESSVPGGLRQSIVRLCDEMAPSLGARPELSFRGAIDNTVPKQTADHILAVVREALTNAGKYADATVYRVTLRVEDDIVLEVSDNGAGFDHAAATITGLGLVNLKNRAEKLNGSLDVLSTATEGTRLTWTVPI
ncbi:MAG TPA: GAF domain-containing sensor histidine kinase [Acidimicrobiales bacterium]